jgi:CHAD domain-containing protein/CYTH domain-containing protein
MTLLASSAQEGARLIALALLDQAHAASERLHDAGDSEALHDVRVALRRLRSCLRAFDEILGRAVPKRWRRRLNRLARRTGPGRDAEVQLRWLRERGAALDEQEQSGARWLEAQLEARVTAEYSALRDRLPSRLGKLERGLRGSLDTYRLDVRVGAHTKPEPFVAIVRVALHDQIDALVRDLACVQSLEDEDQAHQARIHGKRLRYLLEPLRDEVPDAIDAIDQLKGLQDLLGDLNDLHGLAAFFGEGLEQAALERARRLRDAALETPDGAGIDAVLRADERPGLLALLTRIQSDRSEIFEQVRSQWIENGDQIAKLRESVARVEAVLDEHASATGHEIERKYLLNALPPEVASHPHERIEQGYVPGRKLHERVRRIETADAVRLVRTVKLGHGVVRIEVEEETSPAIFESLWGLTHGRRVRKIRYRVPAGELCWEIDAFEDRELFLAEIELPSEDTQVVIPEWLAPYVVREVTQDREYTNLSLAK